jgi:hypothetical protein
MRQLNKYKFLEMLVTGQGFSSWTENHRVLCDYQRTIKELLKIIKNSRERPKPFPEAAICRLEYDWKSLHYSIKPFESINDWFMVTELEPLIMWLRLDMRRVATQW